VSIPPLIPRKLLFGNPDHVMVEISPDGAHLSWLAPVDGVLNVWVAPRDNLEAARPVTHDTGRGIRFYGWAYTCQHILFIQDKDGDENWHLYSVNIETQTELDLTPFEGVAAQVNKASPDFPDKVVVGLNNRDPQWHDLYQINIVTGERTLLVEHNRFAGFDVDNALHVRLGAQMTEDGGIDLYLLEGSDWQAWDRYPQEDMLNFSTVGFDKTNQFVYLQDAKERDKAALWEVNLATRARHLIAEDDLADLDKVVFHPTKKTPQAAAFTYERTTWKTIDPDIQPDLDFLEGVVDGDLEILSRSLDDRFWVVHFLVDDGPVRYYLYNRSEKEALFLFTSRPALEGQPLVKMHPVVIPSRDGLNLVSYYSLPPGSDSNGDGVPDHPLPLVLAPHGGPWARDLWGYNPWFQWLANRGYAVLSVNFRSSTGFGKAFINAGDFQWGEKIMEDQQDAVHWAIDQGIADPDQIAVLGGSFGGYSVLAGMTFYPEVFACGVDIVGPSNLITLLETVPPYWKPMVNLFTSRVGDHRTEAGRALLNKHSPLNYVDRIRRPLLIGQGANDPRVKQAESDQIVEAMQAKNIPVTYVLYPDEGHGFARPENRLSFYAVTEAFLARVLEGRFEPPGGDFEGSSLKVLTGAEDVPGLTEALASKQ